MISIEDVLEMSGSSSTGPGSLTFELVFPVRTRIYFPRPGALTTPISPSISFTQFFGNGCAESSTAKFSTDRLVGLGKIIKN